MWGNMTHLKPFFMLLIIVVLLGCAPKKIDIAAPVYKPKEVIKDLATDVNKFFKKRYFYVKEQPGQKKKNTVKIFIKEFGSNYDAEPYLPSYLYEDLSKELSKNRLYNLVGTLKFRPKYIIEAHAVKGDDLQLLLNIIDRRKKNIVFTNLSSFSMNDINEDAYFKHKSKKIVKKKYAYLTVKSKVVGHSFADQYTHKSSATFTSAYTGETVNAQYKEVINVGDSGSYPIEQKCTVDGEKREINEEQIYFQNTVEAKKIHMKFSFVGAEWDAVRRKQTKIKKYTRRCYVEAKGDDNISVEVSFSYSAKKKGIFLKAKLIGQAKSKKKRKLLKIHYY